jgi:hypothetical protein
MMMRYARAGLILATSLLATAARADDGAPQSLESLQRAERLDMEKRAAEYPQVDPTTLKDALVFRVEHNALTVYTKLPPTVSMSRVKVDGLPGLCVADVHGAPAPKPSEPYTPTVFMFIRYDFTKPGAIAASLTVQVTPMNTQVSQDIETPTGIRQVSLVQNFPGLGDSEPPVRLRISIQDKGAGDAAAGPTTQSAQSTDAATGDKPLNIECTAPDFVTLRRKYPTEMAKYVEPIFRELQADAAVFGPDRKLAFQVFSPEAKMDPDVSARVKQIVARLDADDFHEREAAAAELQQLDDRAVTSLARLDRSGLSPEQNSRIDSFLSSYKPVSEDDARRLRDDVNFLVDCLYDSDDFVVHSALNRLRQLTGRDIHFEPTLRDDARRAAVNRLRETLANATTRPAP